LFTVVHPHTHHHHHRTRRYTIYKDHVTLADYEIHDGMNLELYYT
jgi:hypothetical protein